MIKRLFILGLLSHLVCAKMLINENFNANYLIPTNWTANSIKIMGPGDYEHMAQIGAVADYLTTPTLSEPTTLNCLIYVTSAGPDLIIETSTDGVTFHPHSNSPFIIPPETRASLQLELSPETKYVKFSKEGGGTVYLDDILIADSVPYSESVKLESRQIDQQTNHNRIYAIKVNNSSNESMTLPPLNFKILGSYNIEEIALDGLKVYQSNDLTVSSEDKLLSTRGRCKSNDTLSFNLTTTILSQQTVYLLVTIDLAEYNYSQEIHHDVKLIPMNESNIFSGLTEGTVFGISQLSSIQDAFTDWDLSDWIQNGNFAIERPIKEGDGSTDYLNFATLSTKNEAGNAVCIKSSPIAYGSWEFWIGEGNEWDTAGGNNYSIILMSDSSELADLSSGTENFHGYFIINNNYFSFCRQDGSESEILLTFGLPAEGINGDTTNKNEGYSFRVTRNLDGKWNFYINEGDVEPTTLRGTVIDNTYQDSVAFAVRTKINNPALKRKLYFDNLKIKSYAKPTIQIQDQVNCYFETVGNQTFVKWLSYFDSLMTYKLFYQDSESNWVEIEEIPQTNDKVYSVNISNNPATSWKVQCLIDSQPPFEIPLQGDRNQILYQYELDEGWNLMGPSGCQNFEESLPQDAPRWTWQNNLYRHNTICGLTNGMWIKSNKREERTFVDFPTNVEPVLNLGWNLISFNSDFTYDFTNLLLFYFQDGHYKVLEGPVKPFQGYWVFRAE